MSQTGGVLCAPISHGSLQNLDVTLIRSNEIFKRAEKILGHPSPAFDELAKLERDGIAVYDEFILWGTCQVDIWAPKTLEVVRPEEAEVSNCAFCCAGPVDTYFDRKIFGSAFV